VAHRSEGVHAGGLGIAHPFSTALVALTRANVRAANGLLRRRVEVGRAVASLQALEGER
jgi:hypothetical protein